MYKASFTLSWTGLLALSSTLVPSQFTWCCWSHWCSAIADFPVSPLLHASLCSFFSKLCYSYPAGLQLLFFLQKFCNGRRFTSLEAMVEDPLLNVVTEHHATFARMTDWLKSFELILRFDTSWEIPAESITQYSTAQCFTYVRTYVLSACRHAYVVRASTYAGHMVLVRYCYALSVNVLHLCYINFFLTATVDAIEMWRLHIFCRSHSWPWLRF